MKRAIFSILTLLGTMSYTFAQKEKQEKPDFAGNNFSLEAALELFKKANSLEEFEKSLNEEANNANNLDLNNDGKTDYIVVADIQEKDVHTIVLSTYIAENKKQDIATIGVEKTGEQEAILQIEGDEDLFPANTIVEPVETEQKDDKSGKGGPALSQLQLIRVNVWFWPSVRFLYAPNYVVWVSPYRWAFYPRWWRPWRPIRYGVFYARTAPYRVFYRVAPVRTVVVARRIYAPRRASTVVVHSRRGKTVVHTNRRGKTTVVKTRRTYRRR